MHLVVGAMCTATDSESGRDAHFAKDSRFLRQILHAHQQKMDPNESKWCVHHEIGQK